MKVIFFIESKKIGGGPVLLLDYASILAANPDYEVYYINYSIENIDHDYKKYNIQFCNMQNCDYTQFESSVFFVPFNHIYALLEKIENLKNAKICTYFWHPDAIDWVILRQIPFWAYNKKDICSFLQMAEQKNAINFMDKSNLLAVNRFADFKHCERYIPIMQHSIAENPLEQSISLKCKEELNIGWLGRLDIDKVYSVINLLDNLLLLKLNIPINVHIVGDGDAKHIINFKKYSPSIRFIFTSYLFGDVRDRYLVENCDFCLAMGMSAVVCGGLAIPTIVPITSEKAFHENKYVYLFDCDKYSLGWNSKDLLLLEQPVYPLSSIISDIFDTEKYKDISQKCLNYVEHSFSPQHCSQLLINALSSTSLTVEDCLENNYVKSHMKKFHIFNSIFKSGKDERFRNIVSALNRFFNRKRNSYILTTFKIFSASIVSVFLSVLFYSMYNLSNTAYLMQKSAYYISILCALLAMCGIAFDSVWFIGNTKKRIFLDKNNDAKSSLKRFLPYLKQLKNKISVVMFLLDGWILIGTWYLLQFNNIQYVGKTLGFVFLLSGLIMLFLSVLFALYYKNRLNMKSLKRLFMGHLS